MIKLEDHYTYFTQRPGELYNLGKDVTDDTSFDGTALDSIWYNQLWHIAHLPFRFNNTIVDGNIETGSDTDQYQVEFEKMINKMINDFDKSVDVWDYLLNDASGNSIGKSGGLLDAVYVREVVNSDTNPLIIKSNFIRFYIKDFDTYALQIQYDAFFPLTSYTIDLGRSSNRWKGVYSETSRAISYESPLTATQNIKLLNLDNIATTSGYDQTEIADYIETEVDDENNTHTYVKESDLKRDLIYTLIQEVKSLKAQINSLT